PAGRGHDEDDGDEGVPVAAPREVVVTGRFAKAGPARIALQGRVAGESFKPLMTLNFQLPQGEASRPEVRTAWARQQQTVLSSADPRGEDSYSHYWNLAIAPRYGLKPQLSE